MNNLVRLRADPIKIRIAMRRAGEDYIATIRERTDGCYRTVSARGRHPELTVEAALRFAQAEGFDGIDLEMAWAYPHPQVTGEPA